jgi:class 3 adenylate cyclase
LISAPLGGRLQVDIPGASVSFIVTVRRARDLLREEGRISLRGLKRELDLDDDALQELVEELVDVQRVGALEGRVLSWVGSAPSEARAAERSPRDYTPRHLADRILQSKAALEGERKQVTVLFADVKSSMELAEAMDPEEWHGILDRFFQILTDGVHRFEGTVNQYTGDGIMALFGAPIAHEDHAQRACYAAIHLRDVLRVYADELRLERGLNFSVRMGLNSGEVVVGKIGDDLRMDYTAQGHTVGLAARMEQIAAADQVYVARPTAALVEGLFRLREVGASRVKGVEDAVHVYELQGVGPLRTRFDLSRARGLTRFVWRRRSSAPSRARVSCWGSWAKPGSARADSASSWRNAAAHAASPSARRTPYRTGRRSRCCPCWRCSEPSSVSRTAMATTRLDRRSPGP